MLVADYPPSLEMFNCSLKVLPGSKSKELATAILAEMTAVGVEPDCETLGQVLRCSHEPDGVEDKRSDDRVTSDHLYIVNDLLNYIDETSVDMNRYDADTFFSIAMEICRFGRNSKLAAKLFNLLETKTLQEIFTQPTQENNFCQNYMLVLLETEDLPTVMNVYEKIVPNLYVPSFFTRRQILQKIRRSKSYEYIPVIWREYMPVFNLCLEICDDMANAECSQELKEEFFQLLDLAFRMKWISKVTAGGRRKQDQTMRWITGEVISHGIKIAVNVDRLETAAKYLMTYYDNRSRINGSVSDGAMDTLVNAFIAKENLFFATELMETIKIWSDLANDDPASLLLNKISKLALVLHPHQLNQIIKPA